MPRRQRSSGDDRRITVLLADAQPLFARRLAAILSAEPDLHVVAQSTDADACARRAEVFKPDVALVDADLLTAQRRPAAEAIADASPSTRILVLVPGATGRHGEVGRDDINSIATAVRDAAA